MKSLDISEDLIVIGWPSFNSFDGMIQIRNKSDYGLLKEIIWQRGSTNVIQFGAKVSLIQIGNFSVVYATSQSADFFSRDYYINYITGIRSPFTGEYAFKEVYMARNEADEQVSKTEFHIGRYRQFLIYKYFTKQEIYYILACGAD